MKKTRLTEKSREELAGRLRRAWNRQDVISVDAFFIERGMNSGSAYRLMAGKSGASIDALVGIATALGVTPGELLDGLEVEQ